MQDKVLTCKKVLQTKQSLGSCGNMSEAKCPVGPHVREGHGKTAYPTFTFILQYIYIKKKQSKHHQKTTLPLPFRASLDAVGVCWSPYHKLFQLRALETFEAATEILQFPGLGGQNATECQVHITSVQWQGDGIILKAHCLLLSFQSTVRLCRLCSADDHSPASKLHSIIGPQNLERFDRA